ncbi:carboxypeptidase B isoform X2 [Strongylocentrotus purpuratus]|uniref:Peptidase M14 domain-containing protein n=1 Tax=Strongylocentrotus purpuratus TaxID=7668 RepID=A0A7M7P8M1_STRPU|nr:carboxypeptidase B isoform X2 [Strongylocentrotus purpuratus]
MRSFFVVLAFIVSALADKDYSGYQVLRVTPQSEDDLTILSVVEKAISEMVDFWKQPRSVGTPVDIMVSPEYRELVLRFIEARGLHVDIMIDDVEKLSNQQKSRKSPSTSADFDFNNYHSLSEINDWMTSFAASHSSLVSLVDLATSYEGRTIRALKVGSSSFSSKPVVWLEGGIHSREWVSPAAMMYMTNMLVEGYGNDADVTAMLDTVDFYMVINYNPDGYEYTWSNDRMWRKTRSNNIGRVCDGVDPNRNWDFQWGNAGTNPCADDYQGTYPNSEREVQEVTDYILGLNDVRVFIDFHAYSQMWLTPWGYSYRLPSDYNQQYSLARDAISALSAVYGTDYVYGSIANTIYPASGSSVDWAYGVAGIKYSYAVELRDTGRYGFLLPADQIAPTAIETFEAVKVIVKATM